MKKSLLLATILLGLSLSACQTQGTKSDKNQTKVLDKNKTEKVLTKENLKKAANEVKTATIETAKEVKKATIETAKHTKENVLKFYKEHFDKNDTNSSK